MNVDYRGGDRHKPQELTSSATRAQIRLHMAVDEDRFSGLGSHPLNSTTQDSIFM
ncbi:hypothetical protein LINPERPRIM_LOCUS7369 [Linum perenne]